MDLARRQIDYQIEDRSWLASAHGSHATQSITLDVTLFTAGTHFPNGFIPSGMALGKVTATGKYGPYGGRANEVQTIAVDATGGTFTVSFDGETSAAISGIATAATVQTALLLLPNLNAGDVVVTGGPGAAGGATPYILTFGGQYAGKNVPACTTAAGSLTGGAGTAVVATTTGGGSAVSDGREVLAGFLFDSERVIPYGGTVVTAVGAPLLVHGGVRTANLPTNHGLDTAGQADVAGRIWFV